MKKPQRIETACWLLYAASILGVLELFTSATIKGYFTTLVYLDVIIYACLFIIALGIHKGISVARFLYAILAVVWYVILVTLLPSFYGHTLNAGLVFVQVVITIVGIIIIYQPKCNQWYKHLNNQ